MNFVAIDFETANGRRASACSIGLAKVMDGRIVESFESKIRPKEGFDALSEYNFRIHRIPRDEFMAAPSFLELWPQISNFIGDLPLVAHNMDFDRDVLNRTLESWGLRQPDNTQVCTLKLSQQLLPTLPAYGLRYVTSELNLPDFQHHESGADAEACARLALTLIKLDPAYEVFEKWPIRKSSAVRKEKTVDESQSGLFNIANQFENHPQNRVANLNFTFTGTIHLVYKREDFGPILDGLGATWFPNITKKTNYLVVGDEDLASFAPGKEHSRKFEKAIEYRNSGCDIQLISEKSFRELIPGELIEKLLSIR